MKWLGRLRDNARGKHWWKTVFDMGSPERLGTCLQKTSSVSCRSPNFGHFTRSFISLTNLAMQVLFWYFRSSGAIMYLDLQSYSDRFRTDNTQHSALYPCNLSKYCTVSLVITRSKSFLGAVLTRTCTIMHVNSPFLPRVSMSACNNSITTQRIFTAFNAVGRGRRGCY